MNQKTDKFVRFASDDDGNWVGEYTIDMLPEKAREIIDISKADIEYCAIEGAIGCESPIEQILGVQLALDLGYRDELWDWAGVRFCAIEPQYVVNIHRKTYRVDFCIILYNEKEGRGYTFAIECDGHEFHEKTKFQAARDKSRDRDLASAFDMVLHYTGSEIYKGNVVSDIREKIKSFFVRQAKVR
jgi:hypothetical protein